MHKGGGVDGLVSHPAGGGHDICALLAQAPGAVPILGHALPILYDPLRFLRTLPPCGDLVEIRVGPVKAIVVCDPNLTRQILIEAVSSTKAALSSIGPGRLPAMGSSRARTVITGDNGGCCSPPSITPVFPATPRQCSGRSPP